jgi:hypothetical protein
MAASYKKGTIRIEGPDLYAIREEFKRLPNNIAARVIGAGLKRAAAPGEKALKGIVSQMNGPTGNLKRAIKTVVKRYPRDGAAVAIVGFVKAGTGKSTSAQGGKIKKGPDRAFHQFWLEFGTRDRMISTPASTPYKRAVRGQGRLRKRKLVKNQIVEKDSGMVDMETVSQQGGYIASSFNKLGPFLLKRSKGGGRVQTTPGYPKAFFRKSATPIHIRGIGAQRPVHAAFEMSKAAIAANLESEMRKALENGRKILEDQSRRAAQMRDLGRHL